MLPTLIHSPLTQSIPRLKTILPKTPTLTSSRTIPPLPTTSRLYSGQLDSTISSARSTSRPASRTFSSLTSFTDVDPQLSITEANSREATSKVLSKATQNRERTKSLLLSQREQQQALHSKHKKHLVSRWRERTKQSPFKINLLADTERIDEEVQVAELSLENKEHLLTDVKKNLKEMLLQQTVIEAVNEDIERKNRQYDIKVAKLKPVKVYSPPKRIKVVHTDEQLASELNSQSKAIMNARRKVDRKMVSKFRKYSEI
ncbi:hypothetical protein RCL1_003421 [Eukaryota sp. TZLM3-RCL]